MVMNSEICREAKSAEHTKFILKAYYAAVSGANCITSVPDNLGTWCIPMLDGQVHMNTVVHTIMN